MFYCDADYLDYKIRTSNTTKASVAEACGLDRTTLWRRLKRGTVTLGNMYAIIAFLKLAEDDVRKIFFATRDAETHLAG